MQRLVILVLFLIPITARADEYRFRDVFASPNGKFELRYVAGQSSEQQWELVEKATGEIRYRLKGDFASCTVLVSDDGLNLIVIDDYSAALRRDDLDVLLFYRNGSQVKKYCLRDLLKDAANVESSVSHFQWFFNQTLSVNDGRLRFKTFELVSYEFDALSGELLKKVSTADLTEDSVYVYGKITKLGGGRFEIDVCRQIRGNVPPGGKISFAAPDEAFVRTYSYHTIIISKGNFVAREGVLLNSCNYRKAA